MDIAQISECLNDYRPSSHIWGINASNAYRLIIQAEGDENSVGESSQTSWLLLYMRAYIVTDRADPSVAGTVSCMIHEAYSGP